MKTRTAFLCLLVLISCERVVVVEETEPQRVSFCDLDPTLEGLWRSDSVVLITEVDTIDSLIIDRTPTVIYELETYCADSGVFLLSYINFAGVKTEDIRSTNFASQSSTVYVFNEQDEMADSNNAGFRMRYELNGDTAGLFRYEQQPNTGQLTTYRLYMRRIRP